MNKELFLYINSFAQQNSLLDKIFIYFGEWIPFFVIGLLFYTYFILKNKDESIYATMSAIVGLSISKTIGLLYFHNRPFMDNIGVVLKEHAPDSSFPSDHTTFIFAIIWTLLLFKETRKLAFIVFPIALIGGFARVVEGVHYPFDILGGIGIGLVGSLVVYYLKDRLKIINSLIFSIENRIFKSI